MENKNGKIWILAARNWSVECVENTEQVLHVKVSAAELPQSLFISAIYGKCKRKERLPLWDTLRDISNSVDELPWLVGGDFNTLLAEHERKGSQANIPNRRVKEMEDFANTIADCQLLDPGHEGPDFTWARGSLFERLDRILIGEGWTNAFEVTRVTVLPRVASDHSPLLIRCKRTPTITRAPFRFQNMWVRHPAFMQAVRRIWEQETGERGMRNLQFKLKRVKLGLKEWNRNVFGNIFNKLTEGEAAAIQAQIEYEEDPNPQNRSQHYKTIAEYLLLLRMEEDFWKQKAAVRWAVEGERNTKYFQGRVKQRRAKSLIHEIQDEGDIISGDEELRASAANFYQSLLTNDVGELEEPNLGWIKSLPPEVDIGTFDCTPSEDEIKKAVFGISAESTSGPDGFSALFFHTCWEVVKRDIFDAVVDFFNGAYMPRSFTATMLVLLPKKDRPLTWADFRPISLCNVTNKIISKVISARLAPLLPLLVAPNQSGFVKGRLLSDNVLLAQELFHELKRGFPSPNVAYKLDMAKAYDRVQWDFLNKIMRKMGFSEKGLHLISRCVNSCWFSVLINGAPAGFFRSTRGLRQGDPLSPSLFILAADYFSRALDNLIIGKPELEFSLPRNSPAISHLAYADDIIIFSQAAPSAVREIGQCIEHYTRVSGQKINMEKSNFYLADKHSGWASRITAAGGFQHGSFPFFYLGIPIFRGVKRTDIFLFLRDKLSAQIHSWSHKYLSFGGRLTLIKSTLGALPLHVFQVVTPTADIIKKMESIIARFFWGSSLDNKRTHWLSWSQICHPIEEGGLGVRRFKELVEAFGSKMWWRFREQNSLWAIFMLHRYCSNAAPTRVKPSSCHSPTWRRLSEAGRKIHPHIKWSIGDGQAFFWEDVWIDDTPLSRLTNPAARMPHLRVKEFWNEDGWDLAKLRTVLLPIGVPHDYLEKISNIPIETGERDKLRWDLTPHGNFSMTSAWDLVRHHNPPTNIFKLIWNANISPSMSIFVWRLLFNRIPVDEKLQWRKISLASKCRCCTSHQTESKEHLFVNGNTALRVWRYFAKWFPFADPWEGDQREIDVRLRWWHGARPQSGHNHATAIVPCLVLWSIWSERNEAVHHNVQFKVENVIRRVEQHLLRLTKAGKLTQDHWAGCRPPILQGQGRFRTIAARPRRRERWEQPKPPWIKVNTSGTFSQSTLSMKGGGLARNSLGDYQNGFWMGGLATSGLEAELKTFIQGTRMARDLGSKVWLETESKGVVDIARGKALGPANLRHLTAEIRILLSQTEFKISHTSRKGNRSAALLASLGDGSQGVSWRRHDTLPRQLQRTIRMEQLGME